MSIKSIEGIFMKKMKIIIAVLSLTLITNAHSLIIDLEERDYLIAGDGLVTFDKSTGLEWLDVSFTQGLSMLEVEANASLWADSWQWVTVDQMDTMFDHSRDNVLWNNSRNEPRVAYPIARLLGPTRTVVKPGVSITNSVFGVSRNFAGDGAGFYTYSFMKGGIALDIAGLFYPNLPFPLCDPEDCVDWYDGQPDWWDETYSSEYFGSWLVRDAAKVPAPPVIYLLGIGLIGLITKSKRWKSA